MKNPEYNKVIDYIKKQIINHHLHPGQRLPAERELSALLGIGRYSVREALRALENRGLLESRAGSGSYLTANPCKSMPDALQFLLISRQVTPQNISQIRRALEQEACRQALIQISSKDLNELSHILDKLLQANNKEAVKLDYAFHQKIFHCAGNPLMEQIMDALSLVCREQMDQVWLKTDESTRQILLKIHWEILNSLLCKDWQHCLKSVDLHYDIIDKF